MFAMRLHYENISRKTLMIIVSLYIQINKKRCIGIVSGLVSYFLVNLAFLMILIMFIWSSFVFNPYISGLSTGGNTITDTPRALLMFGDTLSNLWAIKAMIQMNWKNKKTPDVFHMFVELCLLHLGAYSSYKSTISGCMCMLLW